MSRTRMRWAASLLALALVAAACGDDRDDDEAAPETTAASDDGSAQTTTPAEGEDGATETTAAPESEGETFGELAWPCGPGDGDALADSDVGVTAETITIGAGDDRGFASAPGLNKEQTDAVEAMVAKCNELGGINGREIVLNVYDAAILDVVNAMTQACADNNFMLVGQGFSLDNLQEETRLGCGLASVPAWSVSAAFAHAPLMAQAVPNPADQAPVSAAAQLAALYPEEIQNAATMFGNFAATIETKDKVLVSFPEFGWVFGPSLEYNINGEDDWTPFVLQLKEAGTQMLYFTGSCLPNFQAFMQAAAVNDLELVTYADANFYLESCAAANADGAMDGLHVRMVFLPLEEADASPAVQDYIDTVTGNGGELSLLGMQSTSSFLLWATAADACGADLTRECVLDEIAGITDWTGGGLHVPTDPGANEAPDCGLLLELRGSEYVRVAPEERGEFDCDPSYQAATQTVWVEQAQLDENRVSQLYAGALQE